MNKNIEHLALDDELLKDVNGGIQQKKGNEDLRRVKCRNCGEVFMANTRIKPIICPTCGLDCSDDNLAASKLKDQTVAGNPGSVTGRAV